MLWGWYLLAISVASQVLVELGIEFVAEHESLFGLQEELYRDLKLTTLGKQRAEFHSGNEKKLGLGGLRRKSDDQGGTQTGPRL